MFYKKSDKQLLLFVSHIGSVSLWFLFCLLMAFEIEVFTLLSVVVTSFVAGMVTALVQVTVKEGAVPPSTE